MKAISIRQPWAWAVIYAGKPIENRNRPTKFRGRVLVHASSSMNKNECAEASRFITNTLGKVDNDWLMKWQGVCAAPSLLERGGIIGSVEIVDCVNHSDSPWFFGKHGFVLRDPQPLPFIPWKGQLGFFDVPDELLRKHGQVLLPC